MKRKGRGTGFKRRPSLWRSSGLRGFRRTTSGSRREKRISQMKRLTQRDLSRRRVTGEGEVRTLRRGRDLMMTGSHRSHRRSMGIAKITYSRSLT